MTFNERRPWQEQGITVQAELAFKTVQSHPHGTVINYVITRVISLFSSHCHSVITQFICTANTKSFLQGVPPLRLRRSRAKKKLTVAVRLVRLASAFAIMTASAQRLKRALPKVAA